MQPRVTVLWIDAIDTDLSILNDIATRPTTTVQHTCRDGLASAILASLARGAAVVAVSTDLEATQALGLGADELVRLGPVSFVALERSIERACARAESRATREANLQREADADRMACSLFVAAIGHELAAPAQSASASAASLRDAMERLLGLREKLVGWALLAAPLVASRQLQQELAKATDPAEARSIVADLEDAIRKATLVTKMLARASQLESSGGVVDVREAVEEVRELLRTEIDQAADFRADAVGKLDVGVSRAELLCMVGALVAHALDGVRTVERAKARIVLRASAHDDAGLIELQHNGAAVPSDLRTSIFEQLLRMPKRAGGLEGVRARARRLGGDLFIVNEAKTTTFRLVLPLAETTTTTTFALGEAIGSRARTNG